MIDYIKHCVKDVEKHRAELKEYLSKLIKPMEPNGTYYIRKKDMSYIKYLVDFIEENLNSIQTAVNSLGFFHKFIYRAYIKSVQKYIRAVESDLGIIKAAKPKAYNTFIARNQIEPFRSDVNLVITNQIEAPK